MAERIERKKKTKAELELENERLREELKATQQPIPFWLAATAEAERFNVPDVSVNENQLNLFHTLSWVNTAVTTIASIGSGAELSVKRSMGEDAKDIPNHDLEIRMRLPNPSSTRSDFLFDTLAYYALTGNAYWWLNIITGTPAEIWVIPTFRIVPVPDGQLYIKGYEYDPGNGQKILLGPEEVVHIKGFGPINQWVGASFAEPVSVTAESDKAANTYNRKFFDGNARIPGALAFADMITNPEWEKIQNDIKTQADKRNMLLLRNVKAGGVQWLAMAMNQKDMEFVSNRTFNRDEIWNVYAPGLVSMLSENATEANSRTGKAVLVEQRVWPMLVKLAETITSKICPLYGDNLVAEFDDIRISDRLIDLQEQQQYALTHTVDEIRQYYYGDDPLGDERGTLLPAQVKPEQAAPVYQIQPPAEQPVEQTEEVPQQEEETEAVPEDIEAKAVRENLEKELQRYQRKALKHIGKSIEFISNIIPPDMGAEISGQLAVCMDGEAVKAVFAHVLTDYTPATYYKADYTPLFELIAQEIEVIKANSTVKQDPPSFTVNITNPLPGQETPNVSITNPITVEPPDVIVNVEPTPVTIANQVDVDPTPVQIENKVEMPAKTRRTKVKRDAKGNVSELVTEE